MESVSILFGFMNILDAPYGITSRCRDDTKMVNGLDPIVIGGLPLKPQGANDVINIRANSNKPLQPQSILKISTHRLTPIYRNQNQYNDDSSLESIGVYDSVIESAQVESSFNQRRVSWEPGVKDHSSSQSCSIYSGYISDNIKNIIEDYTSDDVKQMIDKISHIGMRLGWKLVRGAQTISKLGMKCATNLAPQVKFICLQEEELGDDEHDDIIIDHNNYYYYGQEAQPFEYADAYHHYADTFVEESRDDIEDTDKLKGNFTFNERKSTSRMKYVQLLQVLSPISTSAREVVETGRGENIGIISRDDPITARNRTSTYQKNQVGRNKATTTLTSPIYGQTSPPTLPNISDETICRLNELKKPLMSMSFGIKNSFKKSYLKRNVNKPNPKRNNLKKSNSKRNLTITEDFPERASE